MDIKIDINFFVFQNFGFETTTVPNGDIILLYFDAHSMREIWGFSEVFKIR